MRSRRKITWFGGTRLAQRRRMEMVLQDVRYALRTLIRTPAFTVVALLTIAIATGANTTVFGFVNALLFRPAPGVARPGSLVAVYTSDFSSGPYGTSSYPDLLSIRTDATAFQQLAAAGGSAPAALRTTEAAERVRMLPVTGNYFSLLGVRPAVGRLLQDSDASAAASPVAVIGTDLWRRTFNGDPGAIGSVVMLNGRPHTIVGVAAEPFAGLDLARLIDVWTPLVPPADAPATRGSRNLTVVGRLKPGVTLEEAQAQLETIAARLAAEYPSTNRGTLRAPTEPRGMMVLRHSRLAPQFRAQVAMVGAVIMGAVALVLVIACANVANLLLSRATTRGREMAIRLALGASRRRLLRQLITESLLLGVAGGALGVLFSLWTADILPSYFPPEQARLVAARFDMPALAFAIGVSLAASLLFGLAPAIHATRGSAQTLRGDSGRLSDSPASTRMRRVVVASQVAIAVVLIVCAGLLVRSMTNMLNADLGFATRDAVLASVELPTAEFTPEQGQAYYQSALQRVTSIPGVDRAALTASLPLGGTSRRFFTLEGYEPRAGEDMELNINTVSTDYFATLQMPLLAGRAFDARDTPTTTRVAIVNDVLAMRYFQGDALGRQLTDGRDTSLEVVGIVRSGRHRSVQEEPLPVVFYPLTQSYSPRTTLVAKTSVSPEGLIETVRQELVAVDRRVPVFRTITFASHLGEASAADRLTASLVSACGGMALLLATVGIYGVTAYGVIRRTREIGVRIALGASRGHVLRLVLSEGLSVTSIGLAAGLLLSFAASRALSSMLFGVGGWDAGTYLLTPVALALVSVLAALGPARRALRVQPIAVLRQE